MKTRWRSAEVLGDGKEEKEDILHVAIVGTPNSGKTTLFNALTGTRQHTGNWPGVTVEKKTGYFKLDELEVEVVDLPGIYGLSTHSLDERLARDFLTESTPDAVVVVIDSSNLEKNLYLVIDVLSLGIPTVVALNMMDMANRSGLKINVEKLSRALGVSVVTTVATKGVGLKELKKALKNLMNTKGRIFKVPLGHDLEEAVKLIESELPHNMELRLPKRWVAMRLLVKDPKYVGTFVDIASKVDDIYQRLQIDSEEVETEIVKSTYRVIEKILKEVVVEGKPHKDPYVISEKIDKFMIHRYIGVPIFLLVMALVFEATFLLSSPLVKLMGLLFDALSKGFVAIGAAIGLPNTIVSLFSEGLIPGIGAVLTFVPTIFLLFGAIAVLEDTGYMARAAFVADRFMTSIGLSGRAFIPMILGFGCNVPAILATRTLENEQDRRLTLLVIPFMSCSARLPIYVLFASVFFARFKGLVVFSLYFLGIIMAIISIKILRKTLFKSEPGMFVMELPPYRVPSVRNVLWVMWQRGILFVRKAGAIIALTSLVVWLLASLPPGVAYASRDSILGWLGSKIAPVLTPAGFGIPEAAIALITGFLAKEVVIGTLGTLYGVETLKSALLANFTALSAYSFMVMTLLYVPCTATMAAIKQEASSWKWVAFVVVYTLFVGYAASVLIFQIGSFIF